MYVATKNELLQAVECLKQHNLINAAYVLDEAVLRHQFDEKHDMHVLQVVKVPSVLDNAISANCNSDCAKFRSRDCPYRSDEKYKCYRISIYLNECTTF